MSRTLCRIIGQIYRYNLDSQNSKNVFNKNNDELLPGVQKAFYSKRNNAEDINESYKIVKSKARHKDYSIYEGGPNWELLSPPGNRFFLPQWTGPAWQGVNTTLYTNVPLNSLVDFDGLNNALNDKLSFSICKCPSLIKDSLHELFPAPEVVSSKTMTVMILKFNGDIEKGATKFILGAREISERLQLHGYWSDFMNPFSGKPFFSWSNGKNLYKIDQRFRGINMTITMKNNCLVIASSTNTDTSFSGAIYTTAPAKYKEFRTIIDTPLLVEEESV